MKQSGMRVITFKANTDIQKVLAKLVQRHGTTKSKVIRTAILALYSRF